MSGASGAKAGQPNQTYHHIWGQIQSDSSLSSQKNQSSDSLDGVKARVAADGNICFEPESETSSRERSKKDDQDRPDQESDNRLWEKLSLIASGNGERDPDAKPFIGTVSKGSALHPSGACTPCLYAFLPGGCLNGVDCVSCHLAHDKGPRVRHSQQRRLNDVEWKAKSLEQRALERLQNDSKDHLKQQSNSNVQEASHQLEEDDFKDEVGDGTVSKGSSLHDSGQCNPCRYVFATGGCVSGVDCENCHSAHPKRTRARPSKLRRNQCKRVVENNLKQNAGLDLGQGGSSQSSAANDLSINSSYKMTVYRTRMGQLEKQGDDTERDVTGSVQKQDRPSTKQSL